MLSSLRLAEKVRLFRELATLVNAGMSLAMALSTLAEQSGGVELKLAVRDGARQVGQGKRFSEVMAAHPRVFSELNRALIAAGEEGGRLDSMLNLSADYLERDLEFQQTISRETFYPKLICGAVIFIPLITKVIITAISGTIWKALAVGLLGIAAYTLGIGIPLLVLYFVAKRFQSTDRGRVQLDALKLRIPVVGIVIRKFAWARACRALAALYGAGVQLPSAVKLSAQTAGNLAVQQTLESSLRPLQEGKRLSEVLRNTGQVPPLALSMLHTGEETGNIDLTMGKVADYFEAEATNSVKKMTLAIVPVAVIIFGVVILFQLVGFYGGYFGAMMNP